MPPIIDNPPALDELPLSEVYELGIQNLDLELYNEAIKCFNILLKMIRLTMNFIALEDRAYHGLEFFDQSN